MTHSVILTFVRFRHALVLQKLCHVRLFIREQMRITVGDLFTAVSDPLSDLKSAEPLVDQKRYMGMPKVMNADPLDTGGLASGFHVPAKTVFRHRENPVRRLDVIVQLEAVLHFLTEEIRDRNYPHTGVCFRSCDDILPAKPLIFLSTLTQLTLMLIKQPLI